MKFAIIDVYNLFFRCQHVTTSHDPYEKAGMALHIIFRSLRKLYREMNADHMVFCIDSRSWRYDCFPEYKRKRKLDQLNKNPKEHEEAKVFFAVLQDFIEFIQTKTNCTVLRENGIEADDFVARWIQLHPNDQHVILSGDSDFIQLLAPNVMIMDGVHDRLISCDQILDMNRKPLIFHVDPAKGKIKIGKTIEAEQKAWVARERSNQKEFDSGEKRRHATDKSYLMRTYQTKKFEFKPEPEWWKKALFIKIVRGDPGDGIFPAAMGARYEGTKNKTGIREAWEDRHGGGYHWNNFMLSSWEKMITDNAGNPTTKRVTVRECFDFNEHLIDLTKQPPEIVEKMDLHIIEAVQKPPFAGVGLAFLKFCTKQDLTKLSKEAQDHARYLNAPYGDHHASRSST